LDSDSPSEAWVVGDELDCEWCIINLSSLYGSCSHSFFFSSKVIITKILSMLIKLTTGGTFKELGYLLIGKVQARLIRKIQM
jgi:hypothetical protein